MKKLLYLTTLFICASMGSEVFAQEFLIKDKSGIGPRIGYYKAPDADDGTMFIGIQNRVRSEFVGFELGVEYRGEQEYTTSGGNLTITQVPVTGTLIGFLPAAPNFNPYALAGLGAYYTFYDYDGGFINPGDDTDLRIGYHLGFGADFPFNDSAALNVDYRYLFLDGGDNLGDKQFSGNVLTAGLTFYF